MTPDTELKARLDAELSRLKISPSKANWDAYYYNLGVAHRSGQLITRAEANAMVAAERAKVSAERTKVQSMHRRAQNAESIANSALFWAEYGLNLFSHDPAQTTLKFFLTQIAILRRRAVKP